MVSVDSMFKDLIVATGWGSDEQIAMAKRKSIVKTVIMFLSIFSLTKSKVEIPRAELETKIEDESNFSPTQVHGNVAIKESTLDIMKKFFQLNLEDSEQNLQFNPN